MALGWDWTEYLERAAGSLPDLWWAMAGKLRSHCNAFDVTDNSRTLRQFEPVPHCSYFISLILRGEEADPAGRLLRCARNDSPLRHGEEPQATKQSLPRKFIEMKHY